VRGYWSKLLHEKSFVIFTSHKCYRVMKSRRVRVVGHLACMGQRRNVYMALMGKPEAEKPLGRPGHRWDNNIKINFKQVDGKMWTEFIWFRIGVGGRCL